MEKKPSTKKKSKLYILIVVLVVIVSAVIVAITCFGQEEGLTERKKAKLKEELIDMATFYYNNEYTKLGETALELIGKIEIKASLLKANGFDMRELEKYNVSIDETKVIFITDSDIIRDSTKTFLVDAELVFKETE